LYSLNFLYKSAEAAAPAPKAITPVVRVLESTDDMILPCLVVVSYSLFWVGDGEWGRRKKEEERRRRDAREARRGDVVLENTTIK
jgi:hypothetical protein